MKRSLALFCGLAALVTAQEPVKPIPPAGIPGFPGATPPLPGENPVPTPSRAIRPTRAFDPNAIAVAAGEPLYLPALTGEAAADLYAEHSGKRVIITSQATQIQAFFSQKGPLTHAEVAKLLEITLLAEGLAILPDPGDPNIVRIAASGPVGGSGWAPKAYIDDPLALPLTDQLVTYRMQFQNLKPDDALRVFQQVMGQSSPSGSITAVTNASSLVITENSALIRQLIKLKDDIDIASEITEDWVTVVFADVDNIAEQLNEIYNQQASRGATATTRRTTGTAPPGGPSVANAGGAGEDVPIKILPDARTNRILLVGRPTDIATAKALIAGFDIKSAEGNEFTYRLEYLRVGEFITIAADAIEATLGESDGAAAGGRGNAQNTNNNNNNNNANAGADGGRTSLEAQDIPTAPEAIPVGKTLLVANNIDNSIIVNGAPHHIEIVRNLISKLDTEGEQVVISAVIGSYGLNDNLNFGVEIASLLRGAGVGGTFSGETGSGALSVIDPGSFDGLTNFLTAAGGQGSGLSLYGAFDDFGVFVNALEAESNFKTLDRPVVTTRNNRVARISSGQRIAIPSNTSNGGVNGIATTNIEFEDVVLELEIQPLINGPNKVTLEVSLVRDSIGADRTVGSGADALTIPDIATEELTTSVTVENGSAIILGGLITQEDRTSERGIPILRTIPGIGRLFGSTSKVGDRSELVVILRPQIIKNKEDYRQFRDGYETESPFTKEARESLPNTGLLPAQDAFQEEAPVTEKKSLFKAPSQSKSENSVQPPRKSGGGFMKFRRRR